MTAGGGTDGLRLVPRDACEYFVVCDRPADGVVLHPVAGVVPTCRRCADLAGVELHVTGAGRADRRTRTG